MIAEEIRNLLHCRPFKPFRLHIAEQAVHTVPRTDYALLNPAGTMMVVMDEAGHFDWISTEHIIRITHVGESQAQAA
ncbi:MAG: hypothetical protein NTV80_10155 [Verrucomicrobia bacterium]|nr:hypothetical protein [Verrucomicrobiota bacterium]